MADRIAAERTRLQRRAEYTTISTTQPIGNADYPQCNNLAIIGNFLRRYDNVKGHIVLQVGDTEYDTHPGDSWCIPPNVEHGARIIDDSVAIEVFSPVREDYLPGG